MPTIKLDVYSANSSTQVQLHMALHKRESQQLKEEQKQWV